MTEAQEADRPKHDPYQGMEPSGRIPKVLLPEDLPNPERWRYLPEGRIKPGNVFERFLVSSFVAPQSSSSRIPAPVGRSEVVSTSPG